MEQNYIQKVLRLVYDRSIEDPGYRFSPLQLLDEFLTNENKLEIFGKEYMLLVTYIRILAEKGIVITLDHFNYKRKYTEDKTTYLENHYSLKEFEDRSFLKLIGVDNTDLAIDENIELLRRQTLALEQLAEDAKLKSISASKDSKHATIIAWVSIGIAILSIIIDLFKN